MDYLVYAVQWVLCKLRNLVRSMRKAPEFVTFVVEGPYQEAAPPRERFPKRLLQARKPTYRDLGRQVRHVANDARVRGVVFRICRLGSDLTQIQCFRHLVNEIQSAGKLVVAWADGYDTPMYYAACAADMILIQREGTLAALGIGRSYYFLGDALERVGLEADFVAVSPYKTAPDLVMRRDMSSEAREMAEWLAEDLFQQCIDGIAEGRGIPEEKAAELINSGPFSGKQAAELGAVDGVISEEELPRYLGTADRPAMLAPYADAKKKLLCMPPYRPGRHVAVLRIAGAMVNGRSSAPPVRLPPPLGLLFAERVGDITVVQQVRSLVKSKRAAALVIHVDSGGGAMTAAEAIAEAVRVFAKRKPVVVSMGSIAASGGFYSVLPASHLVAHPASLTGSIGVLAGKFVDSGMLVKLLIHREVVSRGERAGFFSSSRHFSEDERDNLLNLVQSNYELFVEQVAHARSLSVEQVTAIGGGRVWTGRQALEHGLVDELGGLDLAIRRARETAGLHPLSRARQVTTPKKLLAPSAGKTTADEALLYAWGYLGCFRAGQALCLCPLVPLGDGA